MSHTDPMISAGTTHKFVVGLIVGLFASSGVGFLVGSGVLPVADESASINSVRNPQLEPQTTKTSMCLLTCGFQSGPGFIWRSWHSLICQNGSINSVRLPQLTHQNIKLVCIVLTCWVQSGP